MGRAAKKISKKKHRVSTHLPPYSPPGGARIHVPSVSRRQTAAKVHPRSSRAFASGMWGRETKIFGFSTVGGSKLRIRVRVGRPFLVPVRKRGSALRKPTGPCPFDALGGKYHGDTDSGPEIDHIRRLALALKLGSSGRGPSDAVLGL